jgi:CheY-like chemotaxis protein
MRVLVIDDQAWGAEALARMLADDGHAVDIAESGPIALVKLAQQRYDLIVCDVRMQGPEGAGLSAELARSRPELLPRIVFMSGTRLDTPCPETP